MRIDINSKHLASQLDALRSVVARKETIPALSNVLIEGKDGKLLLTATDLDNTLQIEIEADTDDGVLCVSLDRLHGLVKALPDSDITIKKLENDWAEIRTETGKYKVPGIKRGSYPETQTCKGQSWECEGADFITGISKVTHHVADNEDNKFGRQEVLFEVNGCLRFVSLNGYCLSVCEVKPEQPFLSSGEPLFAWAIPSKAVSALLKTFDDKDKVVCWADSHLLSFRQGAKLLTARRPVKEFPKYQLAVEQGAKEPVEVNQESLHEALNVITSFIPSGKDFQSAAFTFGPQGISIKVSTPENGAAECEVEGKRDDEVTIGFYPVQLKTALSKTLDETTFCVAQDKAMVITSVAERIKTQQLIMPVRL